MATQAEISLLLEAQDRMSKDIAKVQASLVKFGKTVEKTAKQTKTFSTMGAQISKVMAGTGAASVAGVALKTGISFNVLEENAQLAFQTMIAGSRTAGDYVGQLVDPASTAASLLAQVKTLATQQPFKLTDLIPATQRLLAFGFAAKDIPGVLKDISDTVAGLGGSPELLERVSTAFGQMLTKGKVSGEEMLQLAEAGIPAWQMLAQNVGMLGPRFAKMQEAISSGALPLDKAILQLQKLGEQGKLPAAAAIAAIRKGMAQTFGGLGEKQAKTTAGAFSNLIDAFDQLAGALTKGPFKQAADVLRSVTDAITFLQKGFEGLPKPLQDVIGWIATIITVIIGGAGLIYAVSGLVGILGLGGLLGVLGTVATFIGGAVVVALGLLLTPLGLLVLAVAALALAWSTNFLGIRDWTQWLVEAVGSVLAAGWRYVVDLFGWLVGAAWAALSGGWANVLGLFQWLVGTAFAVVQGGWGAVAGWFSWLAQEAQNLLSDGFGAVYGVFVWLVEHAWAYVQYGWQQVAGWFDWLTTTAINATSGLAQGVAAWWEWLLSVIRGAWDWISGIWERLKSIPAAVGAAAGALTGGGTGTVGFVNGQPIPAMQSGGTMAASGLAYLHAGEVVTPAGGGGAATINVTVAGNVYGQVQFEEAVVRALDKARQHGAVI